MGKLNGTLVQGTWGPTPQGIKRNKYLQEFQYRIIDLHFVQNRYLQEVRQDFAMSATTKYLCCTGRWVGWTDIQDHICFRKYHL